MVYWLISLIGQRIPGFQRRFSETLVNKIKKSEEMRLGVRTKRQC